MVDSSKSRSKWGAGTLVIKKDGPIVYDLKQGKQVNIKYESTSDQESNEDTTTSDEDSTSYEDESSMVSLSVGRNSAR